MARRYSLGRVTKLLFTAILLAGCHHVSTCDRYGAMEAKCGDSGHHENDVARTLAAGMCKAADDPDPAVAKAGARFAKEAACAETIEDCDAYKTCRDAVK
jgi:hypothetical protein